MAETYAAGRVQAEADPLTFVGGLIGRREDGPVTASYWDKQTTRQTSSAGGLSKTTAQLRAGLPPGFSAAAWGITAGVSYPYFLDASLGFDGALATLGRREPQ